MRNTPLLEGDKHPRDFVCPTCGAKKARACATPIVRGEQSKIRRDGVVEIIHKSRMELFMKEKGK